jgi:putative lipoic acid-binding regulatory protein
MLEFVCHIITLILFQVSATSITCVAHYALVDLFSVEEAQSCIASAASTGGYLTVSNVQVCANDTSKIKSLFQKINDSYLLTFATKCFVFTTLH